MSPRIRVRLLHALRSLDDLARDWQRLARLTRAGPFQDFTWAAAWWAVYGEQLQLLLAVVWCEDAVVGIIPLAVRSRPTGGDDVIFIGTGMSDYLDWLLDSAVDPICVLDHLFIQLDLAGLVHLDLMDLPNGSRLSDALRAASLGSQLVLTPLHFCPIVDLPDSPTTYFQSRSRNLREAIRRSNRRSADRDVGPLVIHRSEAFCRNALITFIEMHLAWRKGRDQNSVFATSVQHQTFLQLAIPAAVRAGFAELSCRYHDGELVSSFIILRHGPVRYYYQSCLNPEFASIAPGVGHMARELCRAIADGVVRFDLLRGDEPYKQRWATSTTYTWRAKGSLR